MVDCQIETDLELLLPDDYVNDITERLSLYRKLDACNDEKELSAYQKNLEDRFGEIPESVFNLLNTLRLRWVAKSIGFEKLVLKRNTLIGTFVTDQESPYYQSAKFTQVLNFMKNHPKEGNMAEKNGKLRMRFDNVTTVNEALHTLNKMVLA